MVDERADAARNGQAADRAGASVQSHSDGVGITEGALVATLGLCWLPLLAQPHVLSPALLRHTITTHMFTILSLSAFGQTVEF